MIDYDVELVSALNTVLPTHYELALTSKLPKPCISYQERNNFDEETGDTLGYSRLSYTIKIWDYEIKLIKHFAKQIDAVLRPLGFKRTSSQSLHDKQSALIQQIMTYEARGLEEYE